MICEEQTVVPHHSTHWGLEMVPAFIFLSATIRLISLLKFDEDVLTKD